MTDARKIAMAVSSLQWHVDITSSNIKANLAFKDFEQSQRFMSLLVDFIKVESREND